MEEDYTFKWKELNDKRLLVSVTQDSGIVCVIGLDEETGHRYVLYCGVEE